MMFELIAVMVIYRLMNCFFLVIGSYNTFGISYPAVSTSYPGTCWLALHECCPCAPAEDKGIGRLLGQLLTASKLVYTLLIFHYSSHRTYYLSYRQSLQHILVDYLPYIIQHCPVHRLSLIPTPGIRSNYSTTLYDVLTTRLQ